MTDLKQGLRVAIVGLGPRGLGAVEALILRAREAGLHLQVDAFDTVDHPGAGPNFSPDQTDCCLLNTPARALDIAPDPALGKRVPVFDAPDTDANDADHFPTRAALGSYLADRLSQVRALNSDVLSLNIRKRTVSDVEQRADGLWLETDGAWIGPYADVLLTLGQPQTRPDDQLAAWIDHVAAGHGALRAAYPDRALLEAAQGWAGQTVAIRGLGLSTMDVLRVLTTGLGGEFTASGYRRSGREPARILPFSLNGQPPAPKPVSQAVDQLFDLSDRELASIIDALCSGMQQGPDGALMTFCAGLAPPVVRILDEVGSPATAADVDRWLATEQTDPGGQATLPPLQTLQHTIAMAEGRSPADVGFTVGQVMRKLENAIRKAFNPETVLPQTAKALVGFNEGLSRYSYGPPLRSARELLMLVEAGVVSFVEAEDPDIEMVDGGWLLRDGSEQRRATVMVDAVLPPPDLDRVTEPLFEALRRKGWITPVAEGLGAQTAADGGLIAARGQGVTNLCLLGRMALGSVIAVDSIHDCFGAATHRWADGVMQRHATGGGQAPQGLGNNPPE
ncbi:FAD/NAD(P)-binding protein [Thalassorhabdomicrobium marinisediminis]|uniref:FAD-dependent urate hydroxylase HpyO/Asp monooxygenase CreE-like FAD/NAD(P)-binding domain-containing protein n=1 Tax=Thalassorhabdomicrobium marinisediminis TaxID=2170577 RepID=A0A2T7G1D1_9RHOB|nr:FAD/NAD(P)-binding domain-containing protein [Thalassorhabdomicrobium marinisediminis]PVA08198.1 hypothetical protein DC363_01490 [Thalassorhabdomicrobium marinisediminis]